MLEMAANAGTTDIAATPHANLQYPYQPELVAERIEELRKLTHGRPRLYSGSDFHLTFDNVQDALANPAKYTLNHKNYLMVEFSDLVIFQNTSDIFARLLDAGIRPVITHPERNSLLQQRLSSLQKWVEDGCYVQVTAQSLTGRFGKTAQAFSEQLLKLNLVHFLASDAHDVKHRPPTLSEAHEWVSRKYSAELADRLLTLNPRAAIDGQDLPPVAEVRKKKGFAFWR